MTSQSESDNQIIPVIEESSINSTNEIEEKNNINDDTIINSNLITTVNNTEDDNRSKKVFNSKIKYSSMPYYRSSSYTNGHPYGPAPYYYYQVSSIHEKPSPLMVIPTQSKSSTTTDNQNSNSTIISPQNLPPRLRQTSLNENDSNLQQSTTTTTINNRRHRSILPRGSCNYYSAYPPPPLMATPPGVLFPYPPTVHQPGHIAYNIRTPDELELLAFQQQFMNYPPPPLIWSSPPTTTAYPHFPSFSMYGPSSYIYDNSSTTNSNNSLLNPEAAEWIPPSTDTDTSSSDNNILIDDDINFPPLNTNNIRIEENNSEEKSSSIEIDSTNDNTTISLKTDSINSNLSLNQDDNNKHLSSSKLTTITYSNVILQTPDTNKSNRNLNSNRQQQQQSSSSNPTHIQNRSKDQIIKKQRIQNRISKDNSSRRYPSQLNRNQNSLPIETPKQQQQLTDDWIEVKSKKTKKYDRSINDIQYENSPKFLSDEPIHPKILSPPLSFSSTGENTTGTYTSEDDDDDDNKNHLNTKLVMILENKNITTTDYNQILIDDIHRRLDNNERLLIIIRGCPGSGKSTLAKSLNNGYNGQILSTDEYLFDSSKLENAHQYNYRLASEAFKQNISPIIIDNTNITSCEMKPYVTMGKEVGYDILLIEPQTPWRYKARELVKRNLHNLSLRRIKEMLNRFEHNITVQNLIDQTKTNNSFSTCQSQQSLLDQNQIDNKSIDSILISKKYYDIIIDSNILDDVRLCINDMISFLTSSFYQISFSDLSLIPSSSSSSSLPTTPSTPHSLFHRSLSRFSSTTINQDHSFSNEHFLRLPTTTFSRCIENLTPSSSSTNSSIIGKKRRKNKNKQQSNDILFNTNNNNNNDNMMNNNDYYLQQSTYNVYLPEDYSNFIVIDEENDFTQNIHLQKNSYW